MLLSNRHKHKIKQLKSRLFKKMSSQSQYLVETIIWKSLNFFIISLTSRTYGQHILEVPLCKQKVKAVSFFYHSWRLLECQLPQLPINALLHCSQMDTRKIKIQIMRTHLYHNVVPSGSNSITVFCWDNYLKTLSTKCRITHQSTLWVNNDHRLRPPTPLDDL